MSYFHYSHRPPPPGRPTSQDGSPGATNLPLVLGEQLGTAEEVLISGERDHRLRELPQVELQQGGHCVHIGCAASRGTHLRHGCQGTAGVTSALPRPSPPPRVASALMGPQGREERTLYLHSLPQSRKGPGCFQELCTEVPRGQELLELQLKDNSQLKPLLRTPVPQAWVSSQGWQGLPHRQNGTLHCCKSHRALQGTVAPHRVVALGGRNHSWSWPAHR